MTDDISDLSLLFVEKETDIRQGQCSWSLYIHLNNNADNLLIAGTRKLKRQFATFCAKNINKVN